MTVQDDERWMGLALEQARRGVGKTSPNPPVGAVVVRGGELLGSGYHARAGSPHAERMALADVLSSGNRTQGATVYITLEPCSTVGKTSACTDALVQAEIARVVYAIEDPNPAHAGRADRLLRAHGIEISTGVLREAAERLIRPFAKVQLSGLPWVILKTAMSLDGRLTRPPGESKWLTGLAARQRVQQLRGECDAIITSGETVRNDQPQLNLRLPELCIGRVQPWRIVMTEHPDSLPNEASIFADEHSDRTLISSGEAPAGLLRSLVKERGVCTVMLECGGRLAGAFLDQRLVDEVAAFMAPIMTGGSVPATSGSGFEKGIKLDEIQFERIDSDVMCRARIVK